VSLSQVLPVPSETAIPISALTHRGLDELLRRVEEMLYEQMVPMQVILPYREGSLLAIFHQHGSVEQIQHMSDGVHITGRLPGRLVTTFRPYVPPSEKR
jgi:GTP-binding protein HflX